MQGKNRRDREYNEKGDRNAEGTKKNKNTRRNENETWKFMPKEIGEEFWKLINGIWKEEGIPEDWNKGLARFIKEERKRD